MRQKLRRHSSAIVKPHKHDLRRSARQPFPVKKERRRKGHTSFRRVIAAQRFTPSGHKLLIAKGFAPGVQGTLARQTRRLMPGHLRFESLFSRIMKKTPAKRRMSFPMVETKGFEPSTSRMRTERSPTRASF